MNVRPNQFFFFYILCYFFLHKITLSRFLLNMHFAYYINMIEYYYCAKILGFVIFYLYFTGTMKITCLFRISVSPWLLRNLRPLGS